MYKHFFKRVLDIFVSLLGLIICAVPMLLIAIIIKIDSKGPVLFKQQRIGKKGKVFNIYKFRSMCVGAENTGSGVYSDSGKPIAKCNTATASVDVLPQAVDALLSVNTPVIFEGEELTAEAKSSFALLQRSSPRQQYRKMRC